MITTTLFTVVVSAVSVLSAPMPSQQSSSVNEPYRSNPPTPTINYYSNQNPSIPDIPSQSNTSTQWTSNQSIPFQSSQNTLMSINSNTQLQTSKFNALPVTNPKSRTTPLPSRNDFHLLRSWTNARLQVRLFQEMRCVGGSSIPLLLIGKMVVN